MSDRNKVGEQIISNFKNLNKVPRPSNYESAVSNYLLSFGRDNGFSCHQDGGNNVIITKPGQNSSSDIPVILQAHMDMVPAADDAHKDYPFEKNPVIPHTEGSLMTGRGSEKDEASGQWIENPDIHTTLGADDGIGVATIMTILQNKEISHPPLVAVFTTGEEVGMVGAKKLTKEFMTESSGMDLSKARFINVDEEQDGRFCYGCAGGVGITFTKDCHKEKEFSWDNFRGCQLTISGLLGGHSGIDIGTGRANANCLMGNLLYELSKDVPFVLFGIKGGDAENAIAKSAEAALGIPTEAFEIFEQKLEELFQQQKKKYGSVETDMSYSLIADETFKTEKPLSKADQDAILTFIQELPNDAQDFMTVSQKGPNGEIISYEVVKTSCNLGTIGLSWEAAGDTGTITFQSSVRSFEDAERDKLADTLQALAGKNSFAANLHDDYSGWEQDANSILRQLFETTYYEQNQRCAEGRYVHAGLECGVFTGILGNIDMIACGPTIHDVHTPKETLYLDTVPNIFYLLTGVLDKLSQNNE